MNRSPVLAVTGGNHYDVLARLPRLPRPNDRLTALEAVVAPGGMGGNVATAFARLGGRVRFAGSFSDDEDGVALRRDMESEGIDTTFATTRPSAGHQRGFILVGEDGQRVILGLPFQPSALPRSSSRTPAVTNLASTIGWKETLIHRIRKQQLPPEIFQPPIDGFYCPGAFASTLAPRLPPDLPLCIDIETGHLDDLPAPDILAILRRATIVFCNAENLHQLAGRLAFAGPLALANAAGTTIVETRSADGCAVHHEGGSHQSAGCQVESVDTTGAGDCFAAAFIFANVQGQDLMTAARFANVAAALSTRGLGSRGGMPTFDEVERILRIQSEASASLELASSSRSTSRATWRVNRS